MAKIKKGLSIVLVLALLLSVFGAFSVSASSSAIVIDAKNYITGENNKDYCVNHNNGKPAATNAGMEMTRWEWFKYNVEVPEKGIYSISVNASVNSAGASGITVRTEDFMSNFPLAQTTSEGIALKPFNDVGYIQLEKGTNTVYIENSGDLTKITKDAYDAPYFYLQSITFTKASDTKFEELDQIVMAKSYTNETVIDGVTTGFKSRYADAVKVPKNGEQVFTYDVNIARSGYYNFGVISAYRGDVKVQACTIDDTIIRSPGWLSNLNLDEHTFLYKKFSPNLVYIEAGKHTLSFSVTNGNADLYLHRFVFDYDSPGSMVVGAQKTTMSGADGSAVSGTDYSVNSKWNSGFLMQPNHWARYSITPPGAGVYAVTVKVGNSTNGNAEIGVETESGYGVYYTVPHNGDNWGKSYDIGYIYLEEGANTVYAKCTSGTYFIYHNMTLTKVDDSYSQYLGIKDIVIDAKTEFVSTGIYGVDWFTNHNGKTEPVVNDYGLETVKNEMTKYVVSVPVAGAYSINIGARLISEGSGLTIETDGYIADVPLSPFTGSLVYQDFDDAGYIYLKEGENTLWVRNTCDPHYYLRWITLKKVDESMLGKNRLYIPAERYINSETVVSPIVSRACYNTVHWTNAETLNYSLDVLEDGYYDCTIFGAIRNNFKPTLTVDGNAQYILGADGNGYVKGFADDNTVNSKVIAGGVYLTKGTHNISISVEEPLETAWVHGFEFTSYSQEERILNDFNIAETKDQIAALLDTYAEYLGINPAADFAGVLYPEYSYTAMIGYGYGVIDDILEAYNSVKENPMITYQDADNTRTITAQAASTLTIGDSMIAAVYRDGQLVAVDTQTVPLFGDVEFVLENYTAEANDEFKLFVWQSMDTMEPRIY